MTISAKDWAMYVARLSRLGKTAENMMKEYIAERGSEDITDITEFAFGLVTKYGEGAASLACEMYDALAKAQGAKVPPASPAYTARFWETKVAMKGTTDAEKPAAVSRLVKRSAADTTLKNAIRDGAQFAWIPSGDSCAFCRVIASRGWQYASKKSLKNGHAEHIHANCDCQYTIRFDKTSTVEGYDPEKCREMYDNAEGSTPQEKINALRRKITAESSQLYIHESRVVKTLREEYKSWVNGLSQEELHALRKYTKNSLTEVEGKFYQRLNAMLRGEIPEEQLLRDYAETITTALKRQPLRKGIVCYRNQDVNPFGDSPVGSIINSKQFYSTSVIPSRVLQGRYQLTIFAPKGTNGAYIETISRVKTQREFLIDKDCQYRLLFKQGNRIFMEVLI